MKRFYTDVAAASQADGTALSIRLDGRPVRTPARALLVVPDAALADAIVAEWQAQGDKIDPRSMPMTGLANAAIDRVAHVFAQQRRRFIMGGIQRGAQSSGKVHAGSSPKNAPRLQMPAGCDPFARASAARS